MSPTNTIIFNSPVVPRLRAVRDRRETPRIRTPVPVKVRRCGGRHRADQLAVIDNVSAGGFYVRLMQRFEAGERVVALIKFVAGSCERKSVVSLAVRGRVLRVDELPGGVYGIAVRICRHKFI